MITLKQAVEVLDAQVASGENLLNREVKMACGSDMMSDVLAYAKNKAVLLTGLLNIQVVRTADVSDIAAIILFVTSILKAMFSWPPRERISPLFTRSAPCSKLVAVSTVWDCEAAPRRMRRVADVEKEYPVVKDDFERAGAASISIKEMLQQLGLSPELVRRVAIGTYEGEINCLIHGGGGKVLADFRRKPLL